MMTTPAYGCWRVAPLLGVEQDCGQHQTKARCD
jgi:hypothetical protein